MRVDDNTFDKYEAKRDPAQDAGDFLADWKPVVKKDENDLADWKPKVVKDNTGVTEGTWAEDEVKGPAEGLNVLPGVPRTVGDRERKMLNLPDQTMVDLSQKAAMETGEPIPVDKVTKYSNPLNASAINAVALANDFKAARNILINDYGFTDVQYTNEGGIVVKSPGSNDWYSTSIDVLKNGKLDFKWYNNKLDFGSDANLFMGELIQNMGGTIGAIGTSMGIEALKTEAAKRALIATPAVAAELLVPGGAASKVLQVGIKGLKIAAGIGTVAAGATMGQKAQEAALQPKDIARKTSWGEEYKEQAIGEAAGRGIFTGLAIAKTGIVKGVHGILDYFSEINAGAKEVLKSLPLSSEVSITYGRGEKLDTVRDPIKDLDILKANVEALRASDEKALSDAILGKSDSLSSKLGREPERAGVLASKASEKGKLARIEEDLATLKERKSAQPEEIAALERDRQNALSEIEAKKQGELSKITPEKVEPEKTVEGFVLPETETQVIGQRLTKETADLKSTLGKESVDIYGEVSSKIKSNPEFDEVFNPKSSVVYSTYAKDGKPVFKPEQDIPLIDFVEQTAIEYKIKDEVSEAVAQASKPEKVASDLYSDVVRYLRASPDDRAKAMRLEDTIAGLPDKIKTLNYRAVNIDLSFKPEAAIKKIIDFNLTLREEINHKYSQAVLFALEKGRKEPDFKKMYNKMVNEKSGVVPEKMFISDDQLSKIGIDGIDGLTELSVHMNIDKDFRVLLAKQGTYRDILELNSVLKRRIYAVTEGRPVNGSAINGIEKITKRIDDAISVVSPDMRRLNIQYSNVKESIKAFEEKLTESAVNQVLKSATAKDGAMVINPIFHQAYAAAKDIGAKDSIAMIDSLRSSIRAAYDKATKIDAKMVDVKKFLEVEYKDKVKVINKSFDEKRAAIVAKYQGPIAQTLLDKNRLKRTLDAQNKEMASLQKELTDELGRLNEQRKNYLFRQEELTKLAVENLSFISKTGESVAVKQGNPEGLFLAKTMITNAKGLRGYYAAQGFSLSPNKRKFLTDLTAWTLRQEAISEAASIPFGKGIVIDRVFETVAPGENVAKRLTLDAGEVVAGIKNIAVPQPANKVLYTDKYGKMWAVNKKEADKFLRENAGEYIDIVKQINTRMRAAEMAAGREAESLGLKNIKAAMHDIDKIVETVVGHDGMDKFNKYIWAKQVQKYGREKTALAWGIRVAIENIKDAVNSSRNEDKGTAMLWTQKILGNASIYNQEVSQGLQRDPQYADRPIKSQWLVQEMEKINR